MNRLRSGNGWRLGGLVLWAAMAITAPAAAQAPVTAPAPGNPASPSSVVQTSKPFYVEGAVVLLLVGGAVFTVCRGSRRQ